MLGRFTRWLGGLKLAVLVDFAGGLPLGGGFVIAPLFPADRMSFGWPGGGGLPDPNEGSRDKGCVTPLSTLPLGVVVLLKTGEIGPRSVPPDPPRRGGGGRVPDIVGVLPLFVGDVGDASGPKLRVGPVQLIAHQVNND